MDWRGIDPRSVDVSRAAGAAGPAQALVWALLFDLPIALAMGWIVYGLTVWLVFGPEMTISAAIAAAYLGPWTVDRAFAALADKYLPAKSG